MKLLQEAAPPGLSAPELSRLHFAPYMPVTKLLNQNQKQSLDRGRKLLSGFLLENCALIHSPRSILQTTAAHPGNTAHSS